MIYLTWLPCDVYPYTMCKDVFACSIGKPAYVSEDRDDEAATQLVKKYLCDM